MLCLVRGVTEVSAQQTTLSNVRSLEIHNQEDTFYLTSFTIAPETVRLTDKETGTAIQPDQFHIENHLFIWDPQFRNSISDSIVYVISFRVLPFDLAARHSRFDSLLYLDPDERVMESITLDGRSSQSPILPRSGLEYDGTFSRGLSAGNRQDLVLNSNFDLRLAGNVGEGIEILAALSDNSIPLQPDGNTQQLQEFDRIFVQLKKGRQSLIGGDFILDRPESYFINYYKRTQGVRIDSESLLKYGNRLINSVSVAGSTGKFARININAQEGNQGPYRLPGNEGERFVIILAGSERIYVDGILMQRGLEKDYVIDYNAGELTFTPNQLMTKDKRIIAEYEYSDQNYNRSIITAGSGFRSEKLDLQFNAYSEQDGKLSSGLNDLSTEDKRFLSELGDSTQNKLSSSIRKRPEGFDPNLVMYKLVDSLGFTDILVRSTNPDSALYTARFTLLGPGLGDYIPIASETNGTVYQWVAPDPATGERKGTHQPEVQLIAPKQQQMFSLGGTYRLSDHSSLQSEVSLSNNDLNRFSEKDSGDDMGYAVSNTLRHQMDFGQDTSERRWILDTEVKHEFLSHHFQILKPYRNAEFSRDWNIQDVPKASENLLDIAATLSQSDQISLGYRRSSFDRKSFYNGARNILEGRYQKNGWLIDGITDRLKSDGRDIRSNFWRPKLEIAKSLGKTKNWTVGYYYEQEQNVQRDALSDTLKNTSFNYAVQRIYVRKAGNRNLNMGIHYQQRIDDLFGGSNTLLRASKAHEVAIQGRWAASSKSILDGTFTVRDLQIAEQDLIQQQGGLNYLGKINHQFNLWEGAFRSTTAYQISSGQEPRRTFQFIKVDPGQGVYTHIDLNDDGIQQINEFEVAPFSEQAEFIRVTVLTNDFIATNNVLYHQSYSIDPRRAMKEKKGLLSKLSNQGTIRIQRKNLQNTNVSLWNPFTINIADSSLVSVSAQIRNVFYFNRSNPRYDIQYEFNDFRNRFVLTTGYEQKSTAKHILRSRINFNRTWSGLLAIESNQNIQDSERFDNKDYRIEGWEFRPELTIQPSSNFRFTGKYRMSDRKNVQGGEDEKANIHDLNIESTWSKASTSSLRSRLSLVLIDYTGPRNGALEFAMLEGLKDGTNWIWGLTYDRKVIDNIRLNISYDGRKSEGSKVVHIARAQVSAFF